MRPPEGPSGRTRLLRPVAVALLVAPACLHAQERPADPRLSPVEAAATITAADVRARIGVLAHDSMRGRDTPSPELDQAAAWVAGELDRMGLGPGGEDGGWEQRYPIRRLATDLDGSVVRSSTGARVPFGQAVVPWRRTVPAEETRSGPVLLVVGSPGDEALRAAPLEGRVVVFVSAESADPAAAEVALRGGAAAVLTAAAVEDRVWEREVDDVEGRRVTVVGDGGEEPPVLRVRDAPLGDLLGLDVAALRRRAGAAGFVRELPGIELTVERGIRVVESASAPNVVGVLPGSDPSLRGEFVLFSAHVDHIGVGRPDARGDSIYNGADDDASGTAVVLEVAEAMAALATPPRRSVVFLLVSGEEKGLWGSDWYARHPTVPLESVVANVNVDMVGRNWSDTIVAIGKEHSELGETLARVNAAHPELGMTAIDDLWPEENFYGRSDHFNFARRGVPILFFFNGTHADYHGLDDEVEAIDADKTARIGRLLFWLGLEVANADDRPRWDPASRSAIVDGGGAERP